MFSVPSSVSLVPFCPLSLVVGQETGLNRWQGTRDNKRQQGRCDVVDKGEEGAKDDRGQRSTKDKGQQQETGNDWAQGTCLLSLVAPCPLDRPLLSFVVPCFLSTVPCHLLSLVAHYLPLWEKGQGTTAGKRQLLKTSETSQKLSKILGNVWKLLKTFSNFKRLNK